MQKLPKLDRETLLRRRYKFMEEAFKIDGGTSVGFHYKTLLKDARQRYKDNPTAIMADDLQKLTTFDVCHLNHRTDTGEFDGLEWLATASRLEHNYMDGKEPAPHNLTAQEYMYWFLWLLRKSPKNRWNQPRELLEKKISAERLEIIGRIK